MQLVLVANYYLSKRERMIGDVFEIELRFFFNHMMKLSEESLRDKPHILNRIFSLEFKNEGCNSVFCVYNDYHGRNYKPGTAYVV